MRLTIRIEEGELSLLCIRFDFMNRSIHFYYLMYTEACGAFSWENGNFEGNIYVIYDKFKCMKCTRNTENIFQLLLRNKRISI